MTRERPPLRSTIVRPEKNSRGRGAGFLWVTCFALAAYLGTAVAAGQRERGWGFTDAILPEDGTAAQSFQTVGQASWYGSDFQGSPTASGEPFDMNGLTAAHRTLPLGSRALVRNLENDRAVVVKINDRGPYHSGRVLDLSYGAAKEIGMDRSGSARVEITPL
ncbi:MAG TPA: septal ring lytic transglycosylase RlpA family protein [Thermoanaerobaculia bacterium]|jgi:rare lipoprotein A (peptidoglycan hydrolase)